VKLGRLGPPDGEPVAKSIKEPAPKTRLFSNQLGYNLRRWVNGQKEPDNWTKAWISSSFHRCLISFAEYSLIPDP
jgi:hypothetical protein